MDHLKNINLESIITKYSQNSDVLGILLFGSVAKGNMDELSDIDIYVITSRAPSKSREQFIHDGRVVDVLFDSVKEIKLLIKEEVNSVHRNVSSMIGSSRILYSNSNDPQNLIDLAYRSLATKTTYSDDELIMHRYSIDDYLSNAKRECKNRNQTGFYFSCFYIIQNSMDLLLKINGDYYRKPSESQSIINSIDADFISLLNDFYEASSLDKKLGAISLVAQHVLQKTGGLPLEWQIKK
jgi:predicted nucleotidyltransferase